MNDETTQRRRQVAWVCFEPYLSESELIEAIELLEHQFQIDGVSSLISYVSKVCSKYNLDKDIGKSLSVKFFELMGNKNVQLPNDPLPLIEEKRFNAMRQRELRLEAEKAKETAVPPLEDISAHCAIFMCFIKLIIKDAFTDELALAKLLKLCCEQDKKISKDIKAAIESWEKTPQNFRWILQFNEQKLAEISHVLYVCLCEVSGPVEADQIFHRALAVCEQRPEAKKFPPSRLL